MNLLNLRTKQGLAKVLTISAILILTFLAVLFTSLSSSAPPTQDCKNVSGTPQAGDNCLYFYPLPLCKTVPGASWEIPASSILANGITPSHRVNCADLSDLPLCSQLEDNGVTGYPLKNCVKECSDPSFDSGVGVRGSDFAVHDRDCVRFCDNVEAGVNVIPGINCVSRSCHQVNYDKNNPSLNIEPAPNTNCKQLPCKLLTPDELNEEKFSDEATAAYNYCDTSAKCFEFTQAQLPYLMATQRCQIHNCRVPCVDNATDDVQKILDKGANFSNDYKNFINAGYQVGSSSDIMCTPRICKPIVRVPFRCLPEADANPSTRNSNCDSTGDGSTCSNGYCFKTVDCNEAANSSSQYCITSDEEIVGSTDDSAIDSWFYRPKPNSSAVESSGILRDFNNNEEFTPGRVCYSINQMDDIGWGNNECQPIFFGIKSACIYLGYFHEAWLPARSPGKCNAPDLGIRGTGYGYLCGVNLNIYNKPSSETAYQYGYVESSFTDTEGNHLETVCLRFNASGAVGKSCGRRECQITCAFARERMNGGCTQICGRDVCVDLRVKDTDPYQCVMNNRLFESSTGESLSGISQTSRNCMKTIDGYMRVRAVKYGDYICNFLDVKGTLAYDPQYFDGSEKVIGGNYCVSGTKNENGSCSGSKNTNDDPGLAERWRTVLHIPYVQNNQPSSDNNGDGKPDLPQGYLNKSLRLFPMQECIKVGKRVTVPRLYNLSNQSNSPRIFVPPLFIQSASTIRDGLIAVAPEGQTHGDTDFHYPEITVNFGSTTQKLSLGFGKTGYEEEESEIDPKGNANITTSLTQDGEDSFTLEIFVRKEFDQNSKRPTFCLYQKVKDVNGAYLNPQRISCVFRKFPDIDNRTSKMPYEKFNRILVSEDINNIYSNSNIVIRFLSGSSASDTCSSTNASCSNSIILSNPDQSQVNCDSSFESYPICVQRNECSKLNIECIQNEINLHEAKISNRPTTAFELIRNQCNKILLPSCNYRFGLSTSENATITNMNPDASAGDPNAYGWFNELCIVSGFESKLKKVVARITSSGVMGKCVIDEARKTAGANCSAGGKKPDCPCLEYVEGITTLTSNQYFRDETAHEAGLCIDMKLPQLCPAISHNPSPNSDPNDYDFVASSLGNTAYGTALSQINGVVHLSHRYRNEGSTSPNIPVAGHAEFPSAIFGFNNVEGKCEGFWTRARNVAGVEVPPTMSCLLVDNQAQWATVNNECVRYNCPAINTSGADENGNYQGGYTAASDPSNRKGQSHGFALWNSIQSNDFPVSLNANSCITGYKNVGASTVLSNGTVTTNQATINSAALYEQITGYSGGTLPSRQCNQIGQWQAPINSCQRITCAAVNPPIPNGSSDTAAWNLWANSGGATFPSAEAAITSTVTNGSAVYDAATAIGTCNTSLGFFQIGNIPPKRTCDHLGNWGPVQNPCVTQCDAITCDNFPSSCLANQQTHGFATWSQVTNVPINSQIAGSFSSCINGRVRYPYPSLRNDRGENYTLTDGVANYTTTIPRDVKNDNRPVENPKRFCKSVITSGGQANVWTATSSDCVNTCPGADVDPRINVGKTRHNVSSNVSGSNVSGGVITIDWPSTSFGQWAYVQSPSDVATHNGSQYFYGRTNGVYSLARYCNPLTNKWEDPAPLCITNGGRIKVSPDSSREAYASYNEFTRVAVMGYPTFSGGPHFHSGTGTCSPGAYLNSTGSTEAPAVSCNFKDASNKIDETYFETMGVTVCNPMCNSRRNTIYSNSIDLTSPSETNPSFYTVGSTLNLSCKSGFGSAITSSTVSSPFNDCGVSEIGISSKRSASRPTITCIDNNNGTSSWSSSVTNDCAACASCSDQNKVFYNTGGDRYIPICYSDQDCSGSRIDRCSVVGSNRRTGSIDGISYSCGSSAGDGDETDEVNPPSMDTGEYKLFVKRYRRCDDNEAYAFGFRCFDGNYLVIKRCSNSAFDISRYVDDPNPNQDNFSAWQSGKSYYDELYEDKN